MLFFIQKLWAASLLYITSLCLSKLSMTLFIWRLSPAAKDNRLGKIVATVIVIWAVVALLGTAFQCDVPRTWDFWSGRCINMVKRSCQSIAGMSFLLICFLGSMALLCLPFEHGNRSFDSHPVFCPDLWHSCHLQKATCLCRHIPTKGLVSHAQSILEHCKLLIRVLPG